MLLKNVKLEKTQIENMIAVTQKINREFRRFQNVEQKVKEKENTSGENRTYRSVHEFK